MAAPQIDWDVELKLEDPPQTIQFIVEQDTLLGRTPSGQAEVPSVDLTNYNGIDRGVSRRHGMFHNDGNTLTYRDLGGGNGSVLNGAHLTPHEPARISSGDILYLGHFKAQINIRAHTRKTTILASRPDLNIVGTAVPGKGQRVLVVEDDQGLAEMYRLALERSGYTVQAAREMVTAIRALNHQTPSVILLDLMLPGIRGLELCRYVRRDTECPSIPIVVISALRDKESVKGAMDAGADVFMGKPVDWKELTRVVSTLVQGVEVSNPLLQTKRLSGTARLDTIPAEARRDTVVVFIDNYREPLTLIIQPQLTMGRQNPGANAKTHVDLEPYEAFDKGVSRVHLTLRRAADHYEVEDMGSANGTFVNGVSIAPGQPQSLKNGDEVRLGTLRLRMYFLSETEITRS
jgi:DNA-binding response OmpR family regulator